MKIAITLLSGVSYGGITYFRNLIPALAKVDKVNQYHIFIQRDSPLSFTVNQENFHFHVCAVDTQSRMVRLFWEQFVLPKQLEKRKVDIVFTAKNATIFLATCKTIISIRNMEPFSYKNYDNNWRLNIGSWVRAIVTKASMKKADRIITVSQSTGNYIESLFPEIGHKLNVIYNGNPVNAGCLSTNICEGKPQFLLSASKFVAYANQLNLIEGYAVLNKKKGDLPPLWLAGGVHDPAYFRKVETLIMEMDLTEKIKMLGLVSNERLMALYSQASAFLYPSTLEACPHTLIEAMSFGVPIAASHLPPMPEICEKAALYFDPFDKDDIAEKIELLLSNENLREYLRKESLERCRFFDWEKTATQMVTVFQNIS